MPCNGAGTVQLGTCPTAALHPAAPALRNNGSQEVMRWLQDCEKVRNPSSPTDLSLCSTAFLKLFFSAFYYQLSTKWGHCSLHACAVKPLLRAADAQTEMWWTTMTWVQSSKPKTCAHLPWITQPQHMKLWVFPRNSRILHKCRGGTYV